MLPDRPAPDKATIKGGSTGQDQAASSLRWSSRHRSKANPT